MTAPESKLRSLDELMSECRAWREEGLVVVLVNGAFDVLHVGHLRYLAAARALGDRLVAAVNSDLSVKTGKGELRPIIPENERAEILSHLWMVDRICLFDTLTVSPVLELLQPQIHAKGTDYTVETVPERTVVEAYGGRTAICGDPKDHATTDLIGIIVDRFGNQS
jgi:rfaE bifunctional protein nucleotidyltransferase chain/domain